MPEKIIAIYRGFIAFFVMTITGSVGLLLHLISFGVLTNFNRKYLISNSSKLILFLIGIKLKLPHINDWPRHQVLFTFNHNSFLDVLIITALGLQNTRFLLSEKTIKILPLTISALAIGTLYIPTKRNHKRRMLFLNKLERRICNEGFSVFASSEGTHKFIHGISTFNKGIYHVAVVCNLPVVPVYFHIPEECNPLESYKFKSGTVSVELLDLIETHDWKLEMLAGNVKKARSVFIEKYNAAHNLIIK